MQSGAEVERGLVMAARSTSRFLLGRCLTSRAKTINPYTEKTCTVTIARLLHDLGGMQGEW